VTGKPRRIESNLGPGIADAVDIGEDIYFISEQDGDVIARLQDVGGNLGCVSTEIAEAGSTTVPFLEGFRTQKVIEIESENNSSYTLTLFYSLQEINGTGISPSNLNVVKVGSAFDIQIDPNPIVEEVRDPGDDDLVGYTYTTSAFNSFSSFALTDVEFSLAVEMLDFNARVGDKEIVLDWSTGSEKDNKGFELLRQAEGETEFTPIAWVDGHGNSTKMIEYSYIDKDVKTNINYSYRLKMIDFSNNVSFSDVKTAMLKGDVSINISPNPATEFITISISDIEKVENISIVDVSGKLLRTINAGLDRNLLDIDLSAYPVGVYFIRIDTGKDIMIEKVVKQ
jgi:hypothetical protein